MTTNQTPGSLLDFSLSPAEQADWDLMEWYYALPEAQQWAIEGEAVREVRLAGGTWGESSLVDFLRAREAVR